MNVFGAATFVGGTTTGTDAVLVVIDRFFAASNKPFNGEDLAEACDVAAGVTGADVPAAGVVAAGVDAEVAAPTGALTDGVDRPVRVDTDVGTVAAGSVVEEPDPAEAVPDDEPRDECEPR